jgi:hypothetical protein
VKNPINGKDVTNSLKCLKALEMTLNATTMLWNSIQSSCSSINLLCTRRLNQDPLENFSGSIRQQGGNCGNPTPIQFTRSFRKLFFDKYLLVSNGNCSADLDNILIGCSQIKKTQDQGTDEEELHSPKPFEVQALDYQIPSVEENIMSANAIIHMLLVIY